MKNDKLPKVQKKINKIASSLIGWRTNRKLIVFESDDWGSIRMPSLKAFNNASKALVDLKSGDASRYNLYDTLATKDDLTALFEILCTVRDKNNKPAIFTPVSLVANPDFDKIKSSDFQDYFYEPFTETLKRYNREDAVSLWKEGIESRLFVPQFHGREHLNVQVWLRSLQKKDSHTLLAFEHRMWGFKNSGPVSYQAAFDLEYPSEIEYQKTVIKEGIQLFNSLHGYKATFFVPPNGPFNIQLEESTFQSGIKYISTSKIHKEPQGNGKFKKRIYWLGKKNQFGQRYITRNAFFEPSLSGKDWVDSCLYDI